MAKANEAPSETRPAKERMSFYLSTDITEGLRNAVTALPYLTLAGIAEEALRQRLEELQKEHNKGKPFPERHRELKPGRRVK